MASKLLGISALSSIILLSLFHPVFTNQETFCYFLSFHSDLTISVAAKNDLISKTKGGIFPVLSATKVESFSTSCPQSATNIQSSVQNLNVSHFDGNNDMFTLNIPLPIQVDRKYGDITLWGIFTYIPSNGTYWLQSLNLLWFKDISGVHDFELFTEPSRTLNPLRVGESSSTPEIKLKGGDETHEVDVILRNALFNLELMQDAEAKTMDLIADPPAVVTSSEKPNRTYWGEDGNNLYNPLPHSNRSSFLAITEIASIVIGIAVSIALVSTVIFFLHRRRRANSTGENGSMRRIINKI